MREQKPPAGKPMRREVNKPGARAFKGHTVATKEARNRAKQGKKY